MRLARARVGGKEQGNGGLWWATSAPPRVTHRPGGSAEYTPHCIVSGCFALTNGARVRSRVLCSCSFSNVRALSQRPHSRCMAQSPAGSHVHRTRAPIAPGRSGLRVGNIVRRTGCTARGRSSLSGHCIWEAARRLSRRASSLRRRSRARPCASSRRRRARSRTARRRARGPRAGTGRRSPPCGRRAAARRPRSSPAAQRALPGVRALP